MTDEEADQEPTGRIPGRRPEPPPRRPPPQSTPPGGRGRPISVEISPRHIRLTPGQTDTATVSIRYHGAVVDELTLSVTGDAAGWAQVAPDVLNVYPDTEAQTTIRFVPPRGPQPAAGLVGLELTIVAASDPSGSVVQGASIEIEPFDDLSATAQGTTNLSGKREGVLPIKLRNLGNRPVTVSLQATDAGGAMTWLSAPSVALEPGAESTVWATIRPQRSMLFGTPRVHPFTVALSSEHSPPITIDGRFEQLPSLGRGRFGLAALVAAGLLAVGVAVVIALGAGGPTPTQSASPSPTAPPTPTPSASPSDQPSPTPTPSPTSSSSASPTPTVSPSPSASPTASPSPSPSPTPVPLGDVLMGGNWSLSSVESQTLNANSISTNNMTGSVSFSQAGGVQWTVRAGANQVDCQGAYDVNAKKITPTAANVSWNPSSQVKAVKFALCGISSIPIPFRPDLEIPRPFDFDITSGSRLLGKVLVMSSDDGEIRWSDRLVIRPPLP